MSTRLRIAALVLAVVAVVVLAGCGGAASAPPASGGASSAPAAGGSAPSGGTAGNAVTIANFAFSPASLTVKVGDTVTWTNNDSVAHTVTGTDFASSQLAPGSTFSHKFTTAGSFDYHCSIHPSMTGNVTVQ